MIAQSIIDEVRLLLAEGELSQRKIAARLGISRGTVYAIASGRRRDRRRPADAGGGTGHCDSSGPPQRCPGCGGLVYMPCRLCRLRAAAGRLGRSSLQRLGPPDEPLGLDLKDTHHLRYEQISRRGRRRDESSSPPGETAEAFAPDDEPCELDPEMVLDAFEIDEQPLLEDSI